MRTLYGIEYRNFRTAVHGLFLYEDPDTAYTVEEALTSFAEIDLSKDEPFTRDTLRFDAMTDEFDLSEIHYKDVQWDDNLNAYVYRPPFDDNLLVIVINDGHIVHDIFGI